MPRHAIVKVSLTEVDQFRRLVDFLQEVEDYARVCADDELVEMVANVRDDLAEM